MRVGGLVALLALLVAVPAIAIVGPISSSSSSDYDFAASGAQGLAGKWKNTAQLVTITATPTVDATVTAHFSSDNGLSWTTRSAVDTHTATFSFGVNHEGSNQIVFYASDTSPDTESPHTGNFVNIDSTEPSITATGLETTSTQSAAANWLQETTGTVAFVATDPAPSQGTATSGVQEISRSVNGGSVVSTDTAAVSFDWVKGIGGLVEGSNTVTYSAKDWAGNVQSKTGFINIDTVKPVTTTTPALATTSTADWVNAPPTVTLIGTDASSGVASGHTTYWVDADTPHTYATPFQVGTSTSNQSFAVHYYSTDRADNVEATQTAYVNIDTSTPTVSYATAPSRSSGWYNRNVVVTLAGVDTVSGIDITQYRLRGDAAWTDASDNTFTVLASKNAKLTYDYRALDKAGNASGAASFELNMDSTKPRTYGQNRSGRVHRSIRVKYKIHDNLSPKAKDVHIKIKNSTGHLVNIQKFSADKNMKKWYSFKWKPKAKGTYRYYVYAKDLAGNAQQRPVGSGRIRVR